MNKKDISEVRKIFTMDNFTAEHIRVCYVDNEGNKKYDSCLGVHSLPEEELHKYLDLFKKGLSGREDKNLYSLDFKLRDGKEGSGQEMLYELLNDFTSDDKAGKITDRIISSYISPEKYVIISAAGAYDVPGKAKDGREMEDASENVYRYMLTLICPVVLTKGELGYLQDDKRIGEIPQNFIVKAPDKAFLFPAFNGRMQDIHQVLYYTRKHDEITPGFINDMFGIDAIPDATEQAEAFKTLIKGTLPEKGNMDALIGVFESLGQKLEEAGEEKGSLKLDCNELEKVFYENGMETGNFKEKYREAFGSTDTEIPVNNIDGISTARVEMPGIEVKAKPEFIDRIETKIIDGQKFILIKACDSVTVNGAEIKFLQAGKGKLCSIPR